MASARSDEAARMFIFVVRNAINNEKYNIVFMRHAKSIEVGNS